MFKVDNNRELIQREEIIRLLVQFLLQVNDIVSLEVDAGAFAEEHIAAAIEGDDIAETVFAQVFEQEVPDGHFTGPQLLKGKLQLAVVHPEFFVKRLAAHGAQVHDFFGAADGMAQFIDPGKYINDIDVRIVEPGFDEYFVGPLFKDQQADFADCVEIGVAAINIAILQFQKCYTIVHGLRRLRVGLKMSFLQFLIYYNVVLLMLVLMLFTDFGGITAINHAI